MHCTHTHTHACTCKLGGAQILNPLLIHRLDGGSGTGAPSVRILGHASTPRFDRAAPVSGRADRSPSRDGWRRPERRGSDNALSEGEEGRRERKRERTRHAGSRCGRRWIMLTSERAEISIIHQAVSSVCSPFTDTFAFRRWQIKQRFLPCCHCVIWLQSAVSMAKKFANALARR